MRAFLHPFCFTLQRYCHLLWLVWRGGKGVGHINKVKLRRTRLVWELVITFSGSTIPAIPPRVGKMSTSDGFGHRAGEETASSA